MKFAFSTVAVPAWGLGEAVAKGKELGFDAVELHGPSGERAEVVKAVSAGGVKVACVSVPVRYAASRNEDPMAAGVVESAIELAKELGCGLVRMDDAAARSGATPGMMSLGYAEFLKPLVDLAADRGVTLLVSNGGTYRKARHLWDLLDRVQHPGLGASWDALLGVLGGESVGVSVPTLNQRIRHVHLGDGKVGPGGVVPAQLGDGDVGMKTLITRLKGIGFKDHLSINRVAGGDASAYLAEALKRLKDWTKPAVEAKPKVAPKPAAAAGAAKPAGAAVAKPAVAPAKVAVPNPSDAAPSSVEPVAKPA